MNEKQQRDRTRRLVSAAAAVPRRGEFASVDCDLRLCPACGSVVHEKLIPFHIEWHQGMDARFRQMARWIEDRS